MGEEVHHGIENDTRRSVLLIDVLRQFQNAIRLTTQSTNRGGVVEGIASNGEAVDTPETDGCWSTDIALDDGLPCQGVQSINKNPNSNDGDEPVAGMSEMLPQFDKTDIEGEQHDYACCTAKKEEEIVESLFSPGHRPSSYRTPRGDG